MIIMQEGNINTEVQNMAERTKELQKVMLPI